MKVYLSYGISSNSGNNRTKVILDKCKVSRWIWQCTLDFTGHQTGKAGRFVLFVLKILAIQKENHFGRVHWVVQLLPPVNPSGCPAGHSWHPTAALLSSHYEPGQRPSPHRSHWSDSHFESQALPLWHSTGWSGLPAEGSWWRRRKATTCFSWKRSAEPIPSVLCQGVRNMS